MPAPPTACHTTVTLNVFYYFRMDKFLPSLVCSSSSFRSQLYYHLYPPSLTPGWGSPLCLPATWLTFHHFSSQMALWLFEYWGFSQQYIMLRGTQVHAKHKPMHYYVLNQFIFTSKMLHHDWKPIQTILFAFASSVYLFSWVPAVYKANLMMSSSKAHRGSKGAISTVSEFIYPDEVFF